MIEEVQHAVGGADKIDQWMAGWDKIQHLILDPNNLIIIFIFCLGITMKQSSKIPDWIIVFAIPFLGALSGYALFTIVEHKLPALVAFMLGFVYGVAAVFSHQMLKNLLESPYGSTLMKIPLVPILAGLAGCEIPQPKIEETPKDTSK